MAGRSTATATAKSPALDQGEVEFIDHLAGLLAELYVSRMQATRASGGGPGHSEVEAKRRGQAKSAGPRKARSRE